MQEVMNMDTLLKKTISATLTVTILSTEENG